MNSRSKNDSHFSTQNESEPSPPIRILYAAPKSSGRDALVHSLEDFGIQVNCVSSGRDCVAIALAAELLNPYDLVLASLKLPDIDGFSLTMLLRDNGYQYPIATLDSDPFYIYEENSLEAGSDIHISDTDPVLINSILANCSAQYRSSADAIAA